MPRLSNKAKASESKATGKGRLARKGDASNGNGKGKGRLARAAVKWEAPKPGEAIVDAFFEALGIPFEAPKDSYKLPKALQSYPGKNRRPGPLEALFYFGYEKEGEPIKSPEVRAAILKACKVPENLPDDMSKKAYLTARWIVAESLAADLEVKGPDPLPKELTL